MSSPGGPRGPWSHHFVTVDGVRLHYVRQGRGVPVILLHGWPGFWYASRSTSRSSRSDACPRWGTS